MNYVKEDGHEIIWKYAIRNFNVAITRNNLKSDDYRAQILDYS